MNCNALNVLIATSIFLLTNTIDLKGQSTEPIKVIYYNVLNFPNASNNNSNGSDAARHIFFREIIETQDADIIVLQEVTALFGIQNLVSELNTNGTLGKTYNYSTDYYPYSGLGNAIIYNDGRINLLNHIDVPRTNSQTANNGSSFIAPRANSRFIVDIVSSSCVTDKVRLDLFSGHFKGNNNEATSSVVSDRDRRNLAALDFMDYIDNLPISTNIIMGGDFNFYADNVNGSSESEPGYVTMTNSTYNHQFTDPLGGWVRNTSSQVQKYTQSTRTSQDQFGNMGSAGGLDDRFDMIFYNQAIDQATNDISFISGSYSSVASSNILNASALAGSHPLENQVHKMSDHYPVELELLVQFSNCNFSCDGVILHEIHYDNVNTDVNEFVEVAVPVGAGINLSDFSVNLYNGNGGSLYDSETLHNFVLGSSNSIYEYYTWNPSGIQNGGPDGFSLSKNGGHCEFLSYEGSFQASDGPSAGILSTDILVSETGSTPVGESLQLIGGSWTGPIAQTFGAINANGMPCSISNVIVSNAMCNGSAFEFDVTFTSSNSNGTYQIIDVTNGNTIIGTGASNTITVSIPNNTSSSAFDITVQDAIDNTCIGNLANVSPLDCTPSCEDVFINEIAYDNTGGDLNEFIEVAVSNTISINLSDYTISLYNGNGGVVYDSEIMSNFTQGNTDANYIYYTWYPNSIQNGSPDGLSLSTSTLLCELLSYEGSFMATDGPANGMTSTDIGVSDPTSDPLGNSLQLVNGVWIGTLAETPGNANVNSNCITSYTLSGVETGIADYETSGTISSTQTIMGSAVVDYDSAVEITLNFPFEVNLLMAVIMELVGVISD